MAYLAIKTRLAPTAREVADAKEANDPPPAPHGWSDLAGARSRSLPDAAPVQK